MLSGFLLPVQAQRMLSLDSCRALALQNNKQIGVAKLKQDVAKNIRKSARTKYLPHVNAVGVYEHISKEVSILNTNQKTFLGNLGTVLGDFGDLSQRLNALGVKIEDAFRTDTRNIFAGAVVVTQPVFMGGAIIAANKAADIGKRMAQNATDARLQQTIYTTDQAYWTVVSLYHKKRLAEVYLALVHKLSDDVDKMIREGVATRSEGLSVDVKENEAEMRVTQVNDGLVLAKMYLCQLCGLPMDTDLILEDESSEQLRIETTLPEANTEIAMMNRPELKILQNSIDLSKQETNILKAGYMPQVILTGGYAVSNPNVFNGFEKKFAGFWNVGVMVRVPIWNWGDVAYKVRASKGATAIANLELDEARDLIELQVNQSTLKVEEANKRLAMAQTAIERAEENLRVANVGFLEGVITPTTVMEAQTAWLQARSQLIDAQIDVRLSQVDLQKALGTLAP